MTAVAESRIPSQTAPTGQRPSPPTPSLSAYAGLLLLAVLAFAYFWWNRESTEVLFLPLGFVTLWAPMYPLIGFLVMLAVLALCWRVRAGELGAFGALAFVVFSYWAGERIDFTLRTIWERWANLQGQMADFMNPNWSYLWFGTTPAGTPVWGEWFITLFMAIVATMLGCLIGLLLAMYASPVSSPNTFTSQAVKSVNSVIRSIPDVGYALLFAAVIGTGTGLGALAGVLALLMFNIGIVAKLLGESIDAVKMGPLEASDASGANLMQRNRIAVLPQVMPSFVSYSLYVFELNIRASAALGVVGVAGIGSQLSQQMSRFAWENVAAILYALVLVVLLVDLLSMWIRRKLL